MPVGDNGAGPSPRSPAEKSTVEGSILLSVRCDKTKMGQTVVVVGEGDSLRNWGKASGGPLKLSCGANGSTWPQWTLDEPLPVKLDQELVYKYLIIAEDRMNENCLDKARWETSKMHENRFAYIDESVLAQGIKDDGVYGQIPKTNITALKTSKAVERTVAGEEEKVEKAKAEAEEAAAAKKAAEEAIRAKKAMEEAAAAKKAAEEAAAAKKAAEEAEAAKKLAEEVAAAKKAAEEAVAAKKAVEEAAAAKKAAEEAEAAKKVADEAAAAKNAAEEAAAAKKKAAEEAEVAQKAAEEAASAKKAAEAEAEKIASDEKAAEDTEAAKRFAEKPTAAKKAIDEATAAKAPPNLTKEAAMEIKAPKDAKEETVAEMKKSLDEIELGKKVAEEARLKEVRNGAPNMDKKTKATLEALLKRGRISADFENDHKFQLLDALDFKPVKHGNDPIPTWTDEKRAMGKLRNVVEVLKIKNTARIKIEGNTKTPSDQMDAWAYDLAWNRANLVKETLVKLGIDKDRLTIAARPGYLGSGQKEIVFKITGYQ